MPKLPALKPKQVIKALQRAGFFVSSPKRKSSNLCENNLLVTIPYHGRELKPKTLKHVIQQAGFDLKEFLKLL